MPATLLEQTEGCVALQEPGAREPEMEALPCEVAGYVVSGAIRLEIENEGEFTLRPGDAFYVPRNTVHRGFAVGDEPARIITVCHPPKY